MVLTSISVSFSTLWTLITWRTSTMQMSKRYELRPQMANKFIQQDHEIKQVDQTQSSTKSIHQLPKKCIKTIIDGQLTQVWAPAQPRIRRCFKVQIIVHLAFIRIVYCVSFHKAYLEDSFVILTELIHSEMNVIKTVCCSL